MAKRRYEQKHEEKNNAIRERASAFKEKEKVGITLAIIIFPLSPDIFTGYYGYVPATGKTAIRMNIVFIPVHSDYRICFLGFPMIRHLWYTKNKHMKVVVTGIWETGPM